MAWTRKDAKLLAPAEIKSEDLLGLTGHHKCCLEPQKVLGAHVGSGAEFLLGTGVLEDAGEPVVLTAVSLVVAEVHLQKV